MVARAARCGDERASAAFDLGFELGFELGFDLGRSDVMAKSTRRPVACAAQLAANAPGRVNDRGRSCPPPMQCLDAVPRSGSSKLCLETLP